MIELKFTIKLTHLILGIILLSITGTGVVLAGLGDSEDTVTYTLVTATATYPNLANASTQTSLYNYTINMTTNESLAKCNITIGVYTENGTVSHAWSNLTMSNASGTSQTAFWNSTAISGVDFNESENQKWHNITFTCLIDPAKLGNSFFNQTSGAVYLFKVDTVTPVVTPINFTFGNTSAYSYLNLTYNASDLNPDTCRILYRVNDGTETWLGDTEIARGDNVSTHKNCTFLYNVTSAFNGTYLSQTGNATIHYWFNDTGAHNHTGNQSLLVTILYSGWNMVTYSGMPSDTGGASISGDKNGSAHAINITKWLPKCTSISQRNSTGSYTTFAESTLSTNNDTLFEIGDAAWIYCTATDYYMRPDYMTPDKWPLTNTTLYENASGIAVSSKWNLVGMLVDRNLNQTLFSDFTVNSTTIGMLESEFEYNVTADKSSIGNITAVSWYNASGAYYITCMKQFSGQICTGVSNRTDAATTVTIPRANALWIHVNQNTTFNRTAY